MQNFLFYLVNNYLFSSVCISYEFNPKLFNLSIAFFHVLIATISNVFLQYIFIANI